MDSDDTITDPKPHHPEPSLDAEPATVEQMGSLTLGEAGDVAGAERPAGNGFLPADFYAAAGEIEVMEEGSPVSGDLAGPSSFGSPGACRERSGRGDALPSPSSSGYAGERGSSGGSSEIDEAEDRETMLDDWSRGKRHPDEVTSSWSCESLVVSEDDGSVSWRKRKKHFFILSNSGKPIYSRYVYIYVFNNLYFICYFHPCVRYFAFLFAQVVFLVKVPIYLVCISCTEEPYEALKRQLELIYGQVLHA
ncbi:hypothetical protein GW17_00013191 [Ensete ventricosum]|nr:hypothetical protein GW17_00013191 [Ensete ventricosum]RZR80720.1 hypothetical protein BHM03_00006785 [Ensete ventricosum]